MKIIPVLSEQSKQYFVDPEIIPPSLVELESGEEVRTNPFVFGKAFSLLGLSQTEGLIASGTLDPTDELDPAIFLASVYIRVGTSVVKLETLNKLGAFFKHGGGNNFRIVTIDMRYMYRVDTNLHGISNKGDQVTVDVHVSGEINLATSTVQVDARLEFNKNSTNVEATLAMKELISLIGFELNSQRVNHNRRMA